MSEDKPENELCMCGHQKWKHQRYEHRPGWYCQGQRCVCSGFIVMVDLAQHRTESKRIACGQHSTGKGFCACQW